MQNADANHAAILAEHLANRTDITDAEKTKEREFARERETVLCLNAVHGDVHFLALDCEDAHLTSPGTRAKYNAEIREAAQVDAYFSRHFDCCPGGDPRRMMRCDLKAADKEAGDRWRTAAEDRVLVKASQLPADASADTLTQRQVRATAAMILEHRTSPRYEDDALEAEAAQDRLCDSI